MTPKEILDKVKKDFDLSFPQGKEPTFIKIKSRALAYFNYPFLTLLFQSLGSIIVAIEAFCRFKPEIMV